MKIFQSDKSAIDVTAAIKKIRNSVMNYEKSGKTGPPQKSASDAVNSTEDTAEFMKTINQNYNPLSGGVTFSRRRFIGRLLNVPRRIIWHITKPYNEMILERQVTFNSSVVKILNWLVPLSDYFAYRQKQIISNQEHLIKSYDSLLAKHEELGCKQKEFAKNYEGLSQSND